MIREAIYFLIMIVVFLLVLMKAKAPVSLSMAAAAIAGALAAGQGFPVRHFVEGTFSYFKYDHDRGNGHDVYEDAGKIRRPGCDRIRDYPEIL